MTELLFTKGSEVFLDTGLDEIMFAKTKFSRHGDKAGFIVSKDESGKYSVFSEWKFTGAKTVDGKVFFCGVFSCAKPIKELLGNKEILYGVCEAYTYALKAGISLPCLSPSGILAADGKMLFMPEDAFCRSVANHGKKIYSEVQEGWHDSAASGSAALDFTRAVWAYYAVSGSLPYPQDFNDEKIVSIAFRNFLPLEYCAYGINKTLAEAVNRSLKGKTCTQPFPLEELKTQLFTAKNEKAQNTEERRKAEEELLHEAQKYKMRTERKIKLMRLFNRKSAAALAAIFAAAFIAVFSLTVVYESGKKPSVIGLSSSETVKVFYKGIHKMDTDLILAAAKSCPEAQRYISLIPQIYAVSQMRGAYNFESGISTPENWFFFEPDSTRAYSRTIYGITDFELDGNPETLNDNVPTRKNHPQRVRFENGERIKSNSEKLHTAHFYLVHSVDNMIQIEKYVTEVILVMQDNRWQIKKLDQVSDIESVSPAVVSIDFKDALIKSGGDVIAAADILREKYRWIPSAKSLSEEKARLDAIGY